MINVLIADDHPVVRMGLKTILEKEPDISVNSQARTAREALDLVGKTEFDIILLDISLPDRNGLDLLHQLKNDYPELKVLIMSMHPEEVYAVRALKEGASGYLSKDCATADLVYAVRKATSGGRYVSPSLAEQLAYQLTDDFDAPPHRALSNREFQVMCMISGGKTIKDISRNLFLSEKTVSTYRSRILKKMNFKNNAELIKYSIKNNLVSYVCVTITALEGVLHF